MRITYIYHSCFLVELEKCYFLFDYYKGDLPDFDKNKKIYVFNSHSHYDHFNPQLNVILKAYDTTFIFADEINCDYVNLSVSANKTYKLDDMEIKTLKSTDLGVAFIINYNNKVIYHAGDLNDWVWQGEAQKYNKNMTELYRKEIDKIKEHIDVAFLPLDVRQEKWYYCGMKYFMDKVMVENVFPMHFWDDFSVIDRFFTEYFNYDNINFYKINKYNQEWEV